MELITMGCDVEVFTKRGNGEVVPSFTYLSANKEDQRQLNENTSIHCDNVMLEFGTKPVSPRDFSSSVVKAVMDVHEYAEQLGLEVHVSPAATILDQYLIDERATTFGCDPDIDTYTREIKHETYDLGLTRVAGGHIHLGLGGEVSTDDIVLLVKRLDVNLGLWSVLHDKDKIRRQFYGKAGRFRVKPYGIEYRTLSNFWIDPQYVGDISQRVLRSVKEASDPGLWGEYTDTYSQKVQSAINNNDRMLARQLISALGV